MPGYFYRGVRPGREYGFSLLNFLTANRFCVTRPRVATLFTVTAFFAFMPKILTLSNQKGGVGKTTLAFNLYGCLRDEGIRSALIDTDAQGSLHSYSNLSEIDLLPEPEDLRLLRDPEGPYAEYDFIFIDTPPYLAENLQDIYDVSDMVVVPCRAGIPDAYAISGTLELTRAAMSYNPELKVVVVMNSVKHVARAFVDEIRKILQQYGEDYGARLVKAQIVDRVSYARSPVDGTVFETDDEKAQNEVYNLMTELVFLLKK